MHRVYLTSTAADGRERWDNTFEYTRYADLARWARAFERVAAFAPRNLPVGSREGARELPVQAVSASFFDFFDARPALGRFFVASEDTVPAGAPVAVLGHGYWRGQYGGRPDVLGEQILIGRVSYTLIGVAPGDFVGVPDEGAPVAFVPITTYAASQNPTYHTTYNWGWLGMLVRRRPGVSVEAASADLSAAYERSWEAARVLWPQLAPVSVARPRAAAAPVQLGRGPLTDRNTKVSDEEQAALNARLLAEAQAMPGVERATLTLGVPFWSAEARGLWVPGVDSIRRLGTFFLQVGTPDYFATIGTRILRGRGFTAADREGSPPVTVVSESMATVLWPGRDAIGRCIRVGADTAPCTTVVGIAENIRSTSITDAGERHYYLPAAQFEPTYPWLFVLVRGRASDHAEAVRRRLQRLMPGAAYVTVTPMREIVGPERRAWQFGATMFVAFGGLALVLAAIGLYSVIAYTVTQRRQELGVRLALGAPAGHVVRLVVGDGVRLVVVGLVAGAAIALAAGRWVEPLLFQVSPGDPVVFAVVAAVLLGVALAATAVPASRAARVDPGVTLRGD